MNREQALERLCALMSKVAEVEFKNTKASDCICAQASPHSGPAVIDEEILLFIENLVTITLMDIDGMSVSLTMEEEREAERDPQNMGRLRAIKMLRTRLGIGLLRAKEIVDAHLRHKGLML
jgi:hypothetical protein